MAQTELLLETDKQIYNPGDTIRLQCTVPAWEGTNRLGTLNLLIEDTDHKNAWRFRYPIIDGYFEASLALPTNLPQGLYVITGGLQQVFFQLAGRVLDKQKDDSIRYTLQLEDKSLITGMLALNPQGEFRMPRHVFSGQATVFFAPLNVTKNRSAINITIRTPLDSPYNPVATAIIELAVGNAGNIPAPNLYQPDTGMIYNRPQGTLETVTVKAKGKTPVEVYDDENSSGYFKNDRATVFSGLNDEFSGFITILDYLPGRVAGLNIYKNTDEFGQYLVTWRNEPTAFFLDEIPVDLETVYNFPPSEIAMLKVFPPPFMGMPYGSGGGAIAIYSKRATSGKEPRYRNRFVIHGFSNSLQTLRPQQVP